MTMSRMCFRNKQKLWYALYAGTVQIHDDNGYEIGTSAAYGNPVEITANISPAKGSVVAQQFGDDDQYDKVIVTGDRNIPIDEYAVLWIDTVPELDANGALKVNANGDYVTPWDYIVRKVGRGLPNFGSTAIGVRKVTVVGSNPVPVVSA